MRISGNLWQSLAARQQLILFSDWFELDTCEWLENEYCYSKNLKHYYIHPIEGNTLDVKLIWKWMWSFQGWYFHQQRLYQIISLGWNFTWWMCFWNSSCMCHFGNIQLYKVSKVNLQVQSYDIIIISVLEILNCHIISRFTRFSLSKLLDVRKYAWAKDLTNIMSGSFYAKVIKNEIIVIQKWKCDKWNVRCCVSVLTRGVIYIWKRNKWDGGG